MFSIIYIVIGTGANLRTLSSTGGAGGVINIFYPSWRMKIIQNIKLISIISQLWRETWASGDDPLFSHPLGAFNSKTPLFMLDRCCYRVPDHISKLHGTSKKRPLQR